VYRSSYRLDDGSVARLLTLLTADGAALDLDAEARLAFRDRNRRGSSRPAVTLRLRASQDFAELRIEGANDGSPAVFAAGPVQEFLAALGLEPLSRVVTMELSASEKGARVRLRHLAREGWHCEIEAERETSIGAAAGILGLLAPAHAIAATSAMETVPADSRIDRRSGGDRRIAGADRRSLAAT
jgi:hypothetical protein